MRLSLLAGWMAGFLILLSVSGPSGLAQDDPPHPGAGARSLLFSCSFGKDEQQRTIDTTLRLPSLMVAGNPNQMVELPESRGSIRLLRYLPLATPHQRIEVESNPTAPAAVRLSIDGPKLSYERCLIAGNAARNRMTSLIGTWRYLEATGKEQRDALFSDFVQELNRTPRVLVSRKGQKEVFPAPCSTGSEASIPDLGCTVRVLQFLPHYSFDQTMGKVLNLSAKRRNPAVFVEIEDADGREEQWIFARFPDYESEASKTFRYRVTLDCPVEKEKPTPDFVVITLDKKSHELWLRNGETVSSRPLPLDERVQIPSSRYTFHVVEFLPAAALIEEYRIAKQGPTAVTVLEIGYTDGQGKPATKWLELNKENSITSPLGPIRVKFGASERKSTGGR